jgi:2-oxoglutarate ferredoxin oxidoreductase subunit gamma
MAEIKIRFVGSGGMGVILVGIILGKAAIYENKYATQTQSYGAQQRGGKVFSDIIISNEPILYPVIDKADILVAFSQETFDAYSSETKADGLILINSDLIKNKNGSKNIIKIPASTLARDLGNEKVLKNL